MRAVQFSAFGGPDVLRIDEVVVPSATEGQALVRIAATAVQPADAVARAGRFGAALPAREVYRTGWDLVGTVESDDSRFARGTRVIGVVDWLRDLNGTNAEAVVVDDHQLAPAPAGWDDAPAAALPITALTAAQALDLVPEGARTLTVIGAGGMVGGFLLELARDRGLDVLGVAAPDDGPRVRERGARFVDRGDDPVGAVLRATGAGADAVIDTASARTSIAAVRDGGHYVGVIRPLLPDPERGIRVTAVGVHPHPVALDRIGRLAETGRLTPSVALTLPLERAADAHRALEQRGRRGAVVLLP